MSLPEIELLSEKYQASASDLPDSETRIADAKTLAGAGLAIRHAFIASAMISEGDDKPSEQRLLRGEMNKWHSKTGDGVLDPYVTFHEDGGIFVPKVALAYWDKTDEPVSSI